MPQGGDAARWSGLQRLLMRWSGHPGGDSEHPAVEAADAERQPPGFWPADAHVMHVLLDPTAERATSQPGEKASSEQDIESAVLDLINPSTQSSRLITMRVKDMCLPFHASR